jgi:hypothetical protein
MKNDNAMTDLLRRVSKLERAVFGDRKAKVVKSDFKGASGGLRLLLSKGFLIVDDSFRRSKRSCRSKDITTASKLSKHHLTDFPHLAAF